MSVVTGDKAQELSITREANMFHWLQQPPFLQLTYSTVLVLLPNILIYCSSIRILPSLGREVTFKLFQTSQSSQLAIHRSTVHCYCIMVLSVSPPCVRDLLRLSW